MGKLRIDGYVVIYVINGLTLTVLVFQRVMFQENIIVVTVCRGSYS